MDVDSVAVLPGITPATRTVAPNSPNARAKASMNPAIIPLRANGSVMVEKLEMAAHLNSVQLVPIVDLLLQKLLWQFEPTMEMT